MDSVTTMISASWGDPEDQAGDKPSETEAAIRLMAHNQLNQSLYLFYDILCFIPKQGSKLKCPCIHCIQDLLSSNSDFLQALIIQERLQYREWGEGTVEKWGKKKFRTNIAYNASSIFKGI